MGDSSADEFKERPYYLISTYDSKHISLSSDQKRHILGRSSVQDKNIPGKLELGVPSSEAGISRFQAMIRTQVGPEKKVTIRTSDKAKNPTRVIKDEGRTTLYLKPGEQSVIVVGDKVELDSYNYSSEYSFTLRRMGDEDSDFSDSGMEDEPNPEVVHQERPQNQKSASAGGMGALFGIFGGEDETKDPAGKMERRASSSIFKGLFGGDEETPAKPGSQQELTRRKSAPDMGGSKSPQMMKKKSSRRATSVRETRSPEEIFQDKQSAEAFVKFLEEANLSAHALKFVEHGLNSVDKLVDPAVLNDDEVLENYGLKKVQIIKLRRRASQLQQPQQVI